MEKNKEIEKDLNLEQEAEKVAEKMSESIIERIDKKLDEILKEKGGKRSVEIFSSKEVERKDVKDMSKDEKIVGFFKGLLTGNKAVLEALASKKALGEGSGATGGYLFPDEFRFELVKKLQAAPRMRGLVRTIPMKRDVLKFPSLVSRPKVYWTSENEEKTTTSAEYGEVTLTAYKMAAILYASEELVADATEINVVNSIIDLFAEAVGEEEDRVITAGNGTTQPTGLTNASISSVSCSGNLDFDDIINLIYELPVQYRANAKFLVHNTNIKELRKIKDSTGRYLWQEPLSVGQPATIQGYPVIENPWLSESEIYFGDYKLAYWLGDRQLMSAETNRFSETAWTRDQVSIRVVERIAGNVVLPDAVRKLTNIP